MRLEWIGVMTFFVLIVGQTGSQAASPEESKPKTCHSAKEFITTLEYLRDQKDFAVSLEEGRKTAQAVIAGCDGAAKRFIRVANVLTVSGIGTKDALDRASEFALRSDEDTEAFLSVFKAAYLPESLDLDLATSLKIAHDLSSAFDGNTKEAKKDFDHIVKLCLSEDRLNLPHLQCGKMAAKITEYGKDFEGGMREPFEKFIRFARSEDGLNVDVPTTVRLVDSVSKYGPRATENFILAYQYGVSKKGLELGGEAAIDFALSVASQSSTVPGATSPQSKLKTQ